MRRIEIWAMVMLVGLLGNWGWAQTTRSAAVFVKNHAAAEVPDEKVAALGDLIGGHLADQGFRVIDRDDVLNAVSGFATDGANKGDASGAGAKLDEILSNNTSALRLAQNMGADWFLVASITSYGVDEIDYQDPAAGIDTKTYEYKLVVTYRLLDAAAGGSMTGGVIEATKKDRVQPGVVIKRNMLDNLMGDAAAKLADAVVQKSSAITSVPTVDARLVSFTTFCAMGDLTVPSVSKDEQGNYSVGADRYAVEAMNVTVAVDGIAVGTTPGPFQVLPGLHKLRLSRDGFNDWEQTINIRDGLKLNVDMQMTDAGYARWKDTSQFFQDLKSDTKLTDARAQEMLGFAQMLSQSGFRIDRRLNITGNKDVEVRKDIKVNTTQPYWSATQPAY